MELCVSPEDNGSGPKILLAGGQEACEAECLYCQGCGTVRPLAEGQLRPWVLAEPRRPVNVLWTGRGQTADSLAGLVSQMTSWGAGDVRLTAGPGSALRSQDLAMLRQAGVSILGLAQIAVWPELDASLRLGGRSQGWWEAVWKLLPEACRLFGPGNVRVHLALGPGETEEQAIRAVQSVANLGAVPLLRPLRPNSRLKFVPVSQGKVYRILAARGLISQGLSSAEQMQFNEFGQVIHYGLPVEGLEAFVQGGVVDETLADCLDCENFSRQRDWTAWLEDLEAEGEPLAARMRRLCDIDWQEAWASRNCVFKLENVTFSDAEIENETESPYALIASYAPGHDDDDL